MATKLRPNTVMEPDELIRLVQKVNPEAPPAIMRVPEAGEGRGQEAPRETPPQAPQAQPQQEAAVAPLRGRKAPQETSALSSATIADPGASCVFTHRLRESTIMAFARAAKAHGMTQKQFLCHMMAEAGLEVHPLDLITRNRSPMRRRMDEA